MFRPLLAFIVVLVLANGLRADVESGPKVGEKTAPVKTLVATGDNAGKEVEWAAERKDKPTIYVFIDAAQFSRPIARYLKVLDGAVNGIGKDAHVVAIWLTDDADKTKAYLPKAQMSLQFEATTLAQFAGMKSGPENWGLNDRAFVTTVVAAGGKTTATFAYVSVNDTDVRKVAAALREATGEKKDEKKPDDKKQEKPADKK